MTHPAIAPCQRTLSEGMVYCEFPTRQQFANRTEIEAQSYLGIALRNNRGEAIGILCILARQPLQNPERAEQILQVPEMDGYEASRQICSGRAGDRNRDIIIIAMTANAMKGDKEKCLAAGMNDYLAKPITPPALARMLEKWLTTRSDIAARKNSPSTSITKRGRNPLE